MTKPFRNPLEVENPTHHDVIDFIGNAVTVMQTSDTEGKAMFDASAKVQRVMLTTLSDWTNGELSLLALRLSERLYKNARKSWERQHG